MFTTSYDSRTYILLQWGVLVCCIKRLVIRIKSLSYAQEATWKKTLVNGNRFLVNEKRI